jgi:hypothetical protein
MIADIHRTLELLMAPRACRWRFQPEQNLADAFQLLDAARSNRYVMASDDYGEFWIRIEISGRVREAREVSRPRAITSAIARAFGIHVESAE